MRAVKWNRFDLARSDQGEERAADWVALTVIDKAISVPAPAGRHFHVLGRNVLLKYIGETSRLFQLTFFVVVARQFGPAALGRLTVLLMIGSTVGLFVGDLGINTTMIARISGRRDSERVKEVSEAFFWKNILFVLAFILVYSGIYLSHYSGSWSEIFSVTVISLGSVWFEFLSALTNGVNRFDYEVFLRLIYRGVVYGGGTLVAFTGNLAGDLVYMAVAAIVILTVGLMVLSKRLIPIKFSVRPITDIGLLRNSVPIWITQLAQLTYLKFDVVILGLLHVAALETGWYAAAWKIADVLTTVPALLSAAALPLLCGDSAERNLPLIAPRYLKIMYVLPFLFVLPLAIGAGWITQLLYGDSFAGTPRILQILVWAVVPIFVHTFLAIVAVATGRQSAAAKLAALTSALGILIAVLIVPRYGYEAMAVVCLVANSIFAFAMIYKFRDVTGTMQLGVAIKSVGSALGVYGLCSLWGSEVHPVLVVLAGTAAYCLALVLLGVVNFGHMSGAWRLLGSMFENRPARESSPA